MDGVEWEPLFFNGTIDDAVQVVTQTGPLTRYVAGGVTSGVMRVGEYVEEYV